MPRRTFGGDDNSGTFALYAAFGLASIVFVRSRVPETKGRTLEEIQLEVTQTAS